MFLHAYRSLQSLPLFLKMHQNLSKRSIIFCFIEKILTLKDIFEGKTTTLMRDYSRLMKTAARKELFEEAGIIKRRVDMLYIILL